MFKYVNKLMESRNSEERETLLKMVTVHCISLRAAACARVTHHLHRKRQAMPHFKGSYLARLNRTHTFKKLQHLTLQLEI